jgi:hypothetical protein
MSNSDEEDLRMSFYDIDEGYVHPHLQCWGYNDLYDGRYGIPGSTSYIEAEARIIEEAKEEERDKIVFERMYCQAPSENGMEREPSSRRLKRAMSDDMVTTETVERKESRKEGRKSVKITQLALPILASSQIAYTSAVPMPVVAEISMPAKPTAKMHPIPPAPRLDSMSTQPQLQPIIIIDDDEDDDIVILPQTAARRVKEGRSAKVGKASKRKSKDQTLDLLINERPNGLPVKKGRAIKIISMEEELSKSITEVKLGQTFPTIGSYLNHLSTLEFAGRRTKLLHGLRIVMVNKRAGNGHPEITAEANRITLQVSLTQSLSCRYWITNDEQICSIRFDRCEDRLKFYSSKELL